MIGLESSPEYGLESLVRTGNALLLTYLRDDPDDARTKGEIAPQLPRHYTSAGRLEPPQWVGRWARYTVDHLLQLLALRRLVSDGFSATAIGASLRNRETDDLRALVEEGAKLEFEPARDQGMSFLAYLDQVKQ